MSFDTWECHICGKERPDAKISVMSRTLRQGKIGELQINVRYCNDNQNCIDKAPSFDFGIGEVNEPLKKFAVLLVMNVRFECEAVDADDAVRQSGNTNLVPYITSTDVDEVQEL